MTAPPLYPPRERVPRTSLGAAVAGRDNALNFVRLLLASAVIVGHTWPLGGFGSSAWEGVSGVAVNGFFALSGYLIAGSRARTAFLPYLWRRALRILPAFWVSLVAVGFLFSPVAAALAGEAWSPAAGASFVTSNLALWITQWGVPGTLEDVPYANVWNGSLWTLAYEFLAYLAVGVLFFLPGVRRHPARWTAALLLLAAPVALLARGPLDITTNLYLNGLRLALFFLAGMLLWALRDRVPRSAVLGVLSLGLAAATFFLPGAWPHVLGAVPLAYGLLWLGGALPVRWGAVNDVSYGVYIYAFPVQQVLVVLGVPTLLGFWGFAGAAWLLTLPFAWLSWALVERPALRLKDAVGSRPRGTAHPRGGN